MAKMHATGLKTTTKSEITLNRNDATKGTMIVTIPSMTNLINNAPPKMDAP
jgi:hypothetical protein